MVFFLVLVVVFFLVLVVVFFLVLVVIFVFVVVFFLIFPHASQGQVLGQFHHAARGGAADQVAEEVSLQPCAVGEHHVGIGNVARIAGCRLKHVRVGAGGQHYVERDPLTADPAHDVGDDGGGRNHRQLAAGPGLGSRRGEQARNGKSEYEDQHGGPGQCQAHGRNIL